VTTACSAGSPSSSNAVNDPQKSTASISAAAAASAEAQAKSGDADLPGMPPLVDPKDVYAADRPGQLSPVVRTSRPACTCPTRSPTRSP
jgi:hypothetical protein